MDFPPFKKILEYSWGDIEKRRPQRQIQGVQVGLRQNLDQYLMSKAHTS